MGAVTKSKYLFGDAFGSLDIFIYSFHNIHKLWNIVIRWSDLNDNFLATRNH